MESKMKKMRKGLSAALAALMLLSSTSLTTLAEDDERVNQADIAGEVDPTQWVGVDGLGRELTTYEQAGDKKEKTVGMFYWTWHQEQANNKLGTITNMEQFSKLHPEAINDYDNPVWKQCTGAYFWNEPIYGYYSGADSYVLRKQAELLADAGVDFVVFDCTNGNMTWDGATTKLLNVWADAALDGVKVPKVSFMLPFQQSPDTKTSVTNLYKRFYSNEKFKDMWFILDGKPLMIGYSASVSSNSEIYNHFTWRANVASYFEGDKTNTYWGWLHVYPQAVYTAKRAKKPEMTTVGVAMNANYAKNKLQAMNGPNNMGRSYAKGDYSYSYTYKGQTVTVDANIADSKLYGRNFQQQWDYAIEQDPEIIFVTGWNEWIADRHNNWSPNIPETMLENAFPDTFDDENSRDIEPTKGDLKDHYYNQLVSNIRRFKGMSKTQTYTSKKTIDVKGDVSQWDFDSVAVFNHYINNTYDRTSFGYNRTKYENKTMRNDIAQARVAYDDSNIYFYVRTVDNLTSSSDTAWMRLFIDTQEATANGAAWEEYEYVINRESPSADKATLERSTGGWNWEKVADVDYSVSGKVLQIAVPRSALGLTDSLSFNFKWSDNMQADGDIMDFYTNGDVAPGARFMFAFSGDPNAAEAPTGSVSTQAPGNVVTDASGNVVTDDAGNLVTVDSDSQGEGGNSTVVYIAVGVGAVALIGIAVATVLVLKKKK